MFWMLVVLTYAGAITLALALLYFLHPRAWYWHALSAMAALAIGFAPIPSEWQSRTVDLTIGFVFVFLFLWGVAAPLFRTHDGHFPRHSHSH